MGELLASSSRTFDREQCPALADITEKCKTVEGVEWKYIEVRLRCSKTMTEECKIELMENKEDGAYCPIRAWKKWVPYLKGAKDVPIFTLQSKGKNRFLTPKDFNSILVTSLPSVDLSAFKIGSHSFRR